MERHSTIPNVNNSLTCKSSMVPGFTAPSGIFTVHCGIIWDLMTSPLLPVTNVSFFKRDITASFAGNSVTVIFTYCVSILISSWSENKNIEIFLNVRNQVRDMKKDLNWTLFILYWKTLSVLNGSPWRSSKDRLLLIQCYYRRKPRLN